MTFEEEFKLINEQIKERFEVKKLALLREIAKDIQDLKFKGDDK